MEKNIIIINGPNLNLLGKRQPDIYGNDTLEDVETNCSSVGKDLGLHIELLQSNCESDIIDIIHDACDESVGIIINPGAFTHTSVAILDALNAYDGLVIEVHISNIHKRESFRQQSFVSLRAEGVIAGFGIQGYELAIHRMERILS